MKKLLFILLLVSNYAFGQTCPGTPINIDLTSTTSDCGVGPYGSANWLPTLSADILYLAVYITHSTTINNFGTLSSSTGTDWDTVLQVASGTSRIAVYRCLPTTNIGNETLTVTFTGTERITGGFFGHLLAFSGVQLGANGANAIKQYVTGNGNSADPSLTLAALGQKNLVMSWFAEDANQNGTPESGWTEYGDFNCTTPFSMYIMGRVNTTDNTPTVTAGSSVWLGAALELRQCGRRVTLIN